MCGQWPTYATNMGVGSMLEMLSQGSALQKAVEKFWDDFATHSMAANFFSKVCTFRLPNKPFDFRREGLGKVYSHTFLTIL